MYPTAANIKRQQDCFLVYPRDSNEGEIFRIYTIHISCKSDPYRGSASMYGGIIIYVREGEGDWYLPLHEIHVKGMVFAGELQFQ